MKHEKRSKSVDRWRATVLVLTTIGVPLFITAIATVSTKLLFASLGLLIPAAVIAAVLLVTIPDEFYV